MSDDNPFARLAALRKDLPPGPAPKALPAPEKKGPARAVVRMERKGRGGKEVTVIEQLALQPKELNRWLQLLKKSLGCGGVTEGASIVLQGDQRDRASAALEKLCVRKIIIG